MLAAILGLILQASAPSAGAPADTPATSELSGTWSVDLSTEPGRPYSQPMTLTLNPDRTVTVPALRAARCGRDDKG